LGGSEYAPAAVAAGVCLSAPPFPETGALFMASGTPLAIPSTTAFTCSRPELAKAKPVASTNPIHPQDKMSDGNGREGASERGASEGQRLLALGHPVLGSCCSSSSDKGQGKVEGHARPATPHSPGYWCEAHPSAERDGEISNITAVE
jgi:hypothetical protein